MRNTQITACLFFGITLGFHAALQAAAPTAGFTASPTSGEAPLSVAFDASATADSDGIVTSYEWNINGQAIELGTVHADYEMTDASVEFIESATVTRRLVTIEFKTDGSYQVGLQVTDDSGESDAATPQTITVGGGANQEPVAALTATPATGPAPLEVTLDYSDSYDPDGTIIDYAWSANGSALSGSTTGSTKTITLNAEGTYVFRLTVTDDDGATDFAEQTVEVGPDNYTLQIDKSGDGAGTVTASGISCGSDCSQSYASGAEIDLTATAASGSAFGGWRGDCSGGASTISVTMNADRRCTALFEKPPNPEISVSPSSLSFGKKDAFVARPLTASRATADAEVIKDNRLHFKRGVLDPEAHSNDDNTRTSRVTKVEHQLMQFDSMPSKEEREALERAGVTILEYIPDQGYWVAVDPSVDSGSVTSTVGAPTVLSISPEYKLAEEAESANLPAYALDKEGMAMVNCVFFSDVGIGAAENAISSLANGSELVEWITSSTALVRTAPEHIDSLAVLDVVKWVEPKSPPKQTTNTTAADRSNITALKRSPYFLDGSGLTIGVWDEGPVDEVHQEFAGRVVVMNNSKPISNHSTHVGGTIIAEGSGQSNAEGMAPLANLLSYDWSDDVTEMLDSVGRGVSMSNHSYGWRLGWYWGGSRWEEEYTSYFGKYAEESSEWDSVVYKTDLLPFKSAGNDRNDGPGNCPSVKIADPYCDGPYDSIGGAGVSKNVVTVCATDDADGMSTFSGWGPSDDGRIKPDLCANGVGLTSTLPGGEYASYSGTSMASPAATGAAALISQAFREKNGAKPSASLMKALLIHGAKDLGRQGPDYEYGWGLIDAKASVDLVEDQAWQVASIKKTGDARTFPIGVASGTGPLKVTIVWTDFPGSPQASKSLVNDLDLQLVSPSGSIYRPWILDPRNPNQGAVRGANHTDNIEQVVIDNPEDGQWTARVNGYAVPFGPQTFALITRNLKQTETQNLVVTNVGEGILSVSSISTGGDPWLSLNASDASLNSGESKTLEVTVDYSMIAAASASGSITISSNDPANSSVEIPVSVDASTDSDEDGVADVADQYPYDSKEWADADNDGVGDNFDAFPNNAQEWLDLDSDGVGDNDDNCALAPNSSQLDSDKDGIGDACQTANSNSERLCSPSRIDLDQNLVDTGVVEVASEIEIVSQGTVTIGLNSNLDIKAPRIVFNPGMTISSGMTLNAKSLSVDCSDF